MNKFEMFAESFGISLSELPESTKNLIESLNFDFEEIIGIERDELIVEILEKIKGDKQVIASPERQEAWETGWAENLELYTKSAGSLERLTPKFIRSGKPVRLFGRYCKTMDKNFELNYVNVLRSYISEVYFEQIENLYEFGAGTGFNLLHFGKLNPNLNLIGTDFVNSSVQLMQKIGENEQLNFESHLFDMLRPSESKMQIKENSGVLTFGSLEQLGSKISEVMEYFSQAKPLVCVHIEPMIELYKSESLEDYLAIWFQGKRGYSSGLIDLVKGLEKSNKAQILKLKRLEFGSMMMEGYNLLVWKPI